VKLFSEFPRPKTFHCNTDNDPEGKDHEELLQSRKLKELQLDDVGAIGYNPISAILPEGFAYFLPRLIELALDMETKSKSEAEPYLWAFTIQLLPNEHNENKFSLLKSKHRKHICNVLHYIKDNNASFIIDNCFEEELNEAINTWCI